MAQVESSPPASILLDPQVRRLYAILVCACIDATIDYVIQKLLAAILSNMGLQNFIFFFFEK